MNINELKPIVLNMASVYKLIDLIPSETLDREIDDTLLDVSCAILMLVCRETDISTVKLLCDEQLKSIVYRARKEVEAQGLTFNEVITHKSF